MHKILTLKSINVLMIAKLFFIYENLGCRYKLISDWFIISMNILNFYIFTNNTIIKKTALNIENQVLCHTFNLMASGYY